MAGAESSRGQQGVFFRGRHQEIERRAPGAQEAAEWRAPQHRLVVVEAPPGSTFLTPTLATISLAASTKDLLSTKNHSIKMLNSTMHA